MECMDALWLIFGLFAVILGFLVYEMYLIRHIRDTFKKQGDKFARDLIENIVMDEELMGAFLDRIVQVVQNTFASSRGVTAKDQKGLDRRIVSGIIDQNPIVSGFLDQLGVRDYLTKKPHLVFYILSQYPQLLQWFQPAETPPAGQTFANNGVMPQNFINPPKQ